jgi:iron complex transport system ATP-binding protein
MSLEARGLTVLGSAGEAIVSDASLAVRPGELLGLIGPNGAGKSTLLKATLGLKPLAAGTVTLGGRPLADVPPVERARRIAWLGQEGRIEWRLSARDVVALGRRPHRRPFTPPSAADREAVARALATVEMTALADAPATELSAGERARVLLARALAVEAPILLADEPTAALDPYHQLLVLETLRGRAERGGSVLVVLHDLSLAARFLDRVVVMSGGRILADGPPPLVLTDEVLEAVYRIAAVRGQDEGRAWLLPLFRR